ncbi:nesprin-2-like [Amblyraja radiata]|uniref:nesprin-2-like n=1 Tax=Amblyraja radiata TaxID=386614 RepID=UPI00140359A9|nr:nesprin-2-like [Amblyraja radiata]
MAGGELDIMRARTSLPITPDPREIQSADVRPVSMERGRGRVRESCSAGVQRQGRGSRAFLGRVLRAALPLQLLALLLLLLAALLPARQQHYSCTLANNYIRSLHPALRYTNGPPPT